jgi:membrane protein required for colicin V production
MNFIDVVLLIPIAWFAYKGFSKGFIIEVTSLLALLLGIYIANRLSHITAAYLINDLKFENEYIDIIAFTITFILVVIATMLLGKALTRLIRVIQLSFLNKIAGAAFSTLKIVFIMSVIIMIFVNFQIENVILKDEQINSSVLYKPVKSVAPAFFPKLMETDKSFFEDAKKSLDKKLDDLSQ